MEDRYSYMATWLPQDWVPFEVIDLLFGIKPEDERLFGHFRAWAARLRRPREVLRPDKVSRHGFESYLQHSQLLPRKMAGARLGMRDESFVEVLAAMEDRGLLAMNMLDFSPQVVPESLVRRFHDLFPALQHRIFSDHDDYCSRLQAAIRDDLALAVAPLRCVTSEALGQDPPDYADEFDCFTDEPIGLRYQVWLDFGKPINLRPDACSLKLYAQHEADLRDRVMGQRPEIPESLRAE